MSLQVKQPSLSAWLPMAAPEDTAASAPPSDVAPAPFNFSFDTARPAAQDIHQHHTQQVSKITHHETQSLPGNPQMWAGWAKWVQLLAACMCLPTAYSLQVHGLWPNHPPLPLTCNGLESDANSTVHCRPAFCPFLGYIIGQSCYAMGYPAADTCCTLLMPLPHLSKLAAGSPLRFSMADLDAAWPTQHSYKLPVRCST